jgi:NifU-like protein involved in Fe-S cluster formation
LIDDLYSARILLLAANIPRVGRLRQPDATAEKVSKVCGSRVVVDVAVADGQVSDFAQEVQACALGQTTAAIVGAHVIGARPDELEAAAHDLRQFLVNAGPAPRGRFAELEILQPVQAFPARHASACLPLEAAAEAARAAVSARTRQIG